MTETVPPYRVSDEYWASLGVTMRRCLRLMDMIERLQERVYTTGELAERYEVAPRTIQDDLLLIQGNPRYAPLQQVRGWRLVDVKGDDS